MWALFQMSFERRSVAFVFVCFITAASRLEKYSSLKSHCSSITPLLIRLGDNRLIDCRLHGYAVLRVFKFVPG